MRFNLKGLRDSKNKKQSKIYSKAMSLIKSNNETEFLTDSRIEEIRKNHPSLEVEPKAGNSLSIKSKFDSWVVMDEESFFVLYHMKKNSVSSVGSAEGYHVQDVFKDIDFLLKSIEAHDDFEINVKLGRKDSENY